VAGAFVPAGDWSWPIAQPTNTAPTKHATAASTRAALNWPAEFGAIQLGGLSILDAIESMIDRLKLIQRRAEGCRIIDEIATSQRQRFG
jgi:hypothetical protein